MLDTQMEKFVAPASVALVGASDREGSMGRRVLEKLIRNGISRIYPVNPRGGRILGLPCYPSVDALPDQADLLFVLTPAQTVPDILRSAAAKGITAASICSAGFAEAGGPGIELQDELAQIARDTELRMLGPNCMGIYNVSDGLDLTISATLETVELKSGPIAFVSQSGAYGISLLMKGLEMGLGFSKLFSLGNKVDLDDCSILEYLESDPDTEVIMLYLEGLTDGRRFFDVARRVSRSKPVIVFKAGKHEAGARAMQSHTGALAGSYEVFASAMKQCGVIEAESSYGMLEMAKVLAMQPMMKGNRVGIVTNTGGLAVEMADLFHDRGLDLPVFSANLQEKLTEAQALPAFGNRSNPIDLGAPNPAYNEWYVRSTELLLASGEVDAVLVIMAGIAARWAVERFQERAPLLMQNGRPVLMLSIWKEEEMRELRDLYHGVQLPVTEDPVLAAEALQALYLRGTLTKGAI